MPRGHRDSEIADSTNWFTFAGPASFDHLSEDDVAIAAVEELYPVRQNVKTKVPGLASYSDAWHSLSA